MAHGEAGCLLRLELICSEESNRRGGRAIADAAPRFWRAGDQRIERKERTAQTRSQRANQREACSGADHRRIWRQETARQNERRRVKELAQLRLGKEKREPLPGRLVRAGGIAANHPCKPRA